MHYLQAVTPYMRKLIERVKALREKEQPPVVVSEPEVQEDSELEMVDVPEAAQGPADVVVPNHYVLGWRRIHLHELMACDPAMEVALNRYRDQYALWHDKLNPSWLALMHNYDKPTLAANAVRLPEVYPAPWIEEYRRCVTASSIIYGFEVPDASFQMDLVTLEYVFRYYCLMEPRSVDTKAVASFSTYLPMPGNLAELCAAVSQNVILMMTLLDKAVAPNIHYMRTMLGSPMNLSASFTNDQLRKVMTGIYLRAGLQVPRDYLYLDLDVVDYVNMVDTYEYQPSPAK